MAYNYYTVLHFAMAGAFTYAFARTLDIGRAGAFVAGLAYMMAGPLLYHAHHTNIVVGIALLPLLLALIETACRRGTLRWFLGFAAATSALVLGAQPQYTLYDALACGIYLGWRLWLMQSPAAAAGWRRRRRPRRCRRARRAAGGRAIAAHAGAGPPEQPRRRR